MKSVYRYITLLVSVAMIVALSGCGYNIGYTTMHPDIKSIAIAPVTNDTVVYNASSLVRGMLCEAFNVDGSMKLEDMTKADCIVYCRITQATFSEVTRGSSRRYEDDDFRTGEWQANLTAEFCVIIPGRKEPLVPLRSVTGSAYYQIQADPTTNRMYGIQQAGYDMAKKIVTSITEAW